ncbi:MAG: O-antigen/teichoic acid export membrane protein [Oleiphilaceae bacterium]
MADIFTSRTITKLFFMKKKSFLKASIFSFIIRIFGALSAFCFNLSITKVLTISEAGAFFLSFSILIVFWNIGSLGMPIALVRFVGKFHSENKMSEVFSVVSLASKSVLLASTILGVGLFFLADQLVNVGSLPTAVTPILKLMAFTVPAFAICNLIAFSFQGLHKPGVSILLQNILAPLLTCLVLMLFFIMSYPTDILIVSYIFIFCAFFTFIVAICLWINLPGFSLTLNPRRDVDFTKSSRSLYVANIMGLLVQWSGIILVGAFVKEEDVALFSVAQRISMLTSFVLVAVNLVAAPRFSACFSSGRLDELKNTALFCNRIMLIAATPVLLVMLFFPRFFLGLFGDEYQQATLLLQILVIGQFINVVTGSVGYLLNMTGHEKDMRNVVMLSGLLAIILGGVLTPLYGTMGAAVATAIAVASQNLLAVVIVKKRLGFYTIKIF